MTQSPLPVKSIRTLHDLTLDPHNANRGTPRGHHALAHSLQELGAGRSIVADRTGHVIAGNKTLEQATQLDLPVHVIRSDGTALVVVQRTDLDLTGDDRARRLAVADNRASELGLDWDVAQLKTQLAEGLDLTEFWNDADEVLSG